MPLISVIIGHKKATDFEQHCIATGLEITDRLYLEFFTVYEVKTKAEEAEAIVMEVVYGKFATN